MADDTPVQPDAELGPGDIGVVADQGKVVIMFAQPVGGMRFDPENARLVSEQMARCAYEAHFGVEPPDAGSAVAEYVKMKGVDELRPELINRVTIILRSMFNQRVEPRLIAQNVVDAVLREVT